MGLSEIAALFQLQGNRLFDVKTPLTGHSAMVIVDLHATEGLCQLFDIRLRMASQDASIELKQMIGQPITITLRLSSGLASSEARYFNGYVTSFSHRDTDGGFTIYSAVVQPWLWMLSRRQDVRAFQEQTVEDTLTEVFQEYGALASYEFRLSTPTKVRSYCTQYEETDLDFALRLMQEEGLFFYFEHTKNSHKMIIADTSVMAKPIDGRSASLSYSKAETLEDVDVVTSFQATRQLTSSSVTLKTFDYKVPNARRMVSSDTQVNQGQVAPNEIYAYLGEHGFPNSDRGEELARFRTEALAAHSKLFTGVSNSRRLMPARYFQLENHYDHQHTESIDRQFLLVALTHTGQNNYQAGEGGAHYSCDFTCIRKKVPYRPVRTFGPPTIPGPQTAIVVGPADEEIYTDALGRVKVQFHWDRRGKRNEDSSRWVRVAQPWAGSGFGMVNIPRIGDEVVVIFVNGNPDRPLIISRVYNAQNMPPWALPENATQSGILTRSSKGATRENANAIRFEDKVGQEELWLHAEKDQRIEVENDESHSVGNDRTKTVGHDETVLVSNDRTETVGSNETITIALNRTEQVGANETLSVGGNREEVIKGMENLVVALTSTETVGLAKALTVGGGYTVTVAGAANSAVGLASAEEVGLSKATVVGKTYTVKAGDRVEVKTGSASLILESNGNIALSGVNITITASGTLKLKGGTIETN
ncbi:type VI secretion system Vgr family protein [Robbsia andropogonis]|uniref:type VI secretion system Vgr family protein n=1 Tax=Robbsia andropogonis TaxID=28092 RepID=UPI002A69D32C|nr:type VI secretion system tip protein TssI/VgrG [Robbsia andropogonis]